MRAREAAISPMDHLKALAESSNTNLADKHPNIKLLEVQNLSNDQPKLNFAP